MKKILVSSLFKTSKLCSEFRKSFLQHSGQVKLGCLQRLISTEDIYCSAVSHSKILSLIVNTEEGFHSALISMCAKKFFYAKSQW